MENVLEKESTKRTSRITVGDIVKGRDLKVNDIVSIVDTNFPFRVVFKSFFETIVVSNTLATPSHKHRMKIFPFTKVTLLERE